MKIAQRWILARLRNRTFASLVELNLAIAELLTRMNDKPMRGCGGKSRSQLFDELDRPALHALPIVPYTFGEWQIGMRVGQDYHVRWDDQYYSVPYTLVSAKVNLKATRTEIMVFHRDRRVALHPRHHEPGYVCTLPEHQPQSHRAYARDQPAAVMKPPVARFTASCSSISSTIGGQLSHCRPDGDCRDWPGNTALIACKRLATRRCVCTRAASAR